MVARSCALQGSFWQGPLRTATGTRSTPHGAALRPTGSPASWRAEINEGGSILKRMQGVVSETGVRIDMHGKKARPKGYGLPESPFAEFIHSKKTGMRIPNGHGKAGRTNAVSRATRGAPGHQIPGVGIELLQGASKEQTPVIPDGEVCQMQERERVRHLGSAVPSNTGQAGKPESDHPPPGAQDTRDRY